MEDGVTARVTFSYASGSGQRTKLLVLVGLDVKDGDSVAIADLVGDGDMEGELVCVFETDPVASALGDIEAELVRVLETDPVATALGDIEAVEVFEADTAKGEPDGDSVEVGVGRLFDVLVEGVAEGEGEFVRGVGDPETEVVSGGVAVVVVEAEVEGLAVLDVVGGAQPAIEVTRAVDELKSGITPRDGRIGPVSEFQWTQRMSRVPFAVALMAKERGPIPSSGPEKLQ